MLKTFKEKYSDFLYQTVAGMVALNPQERKRCSAIASSLYEFEPQILDLEPFQPPNSRQPQRPSQPYQNVQSVYQQPQQVYAQQQPLYYNNYQQGPPPVVQRPTYSVSSSKAPTNAGYSQPYPYQPVSSYSRGPMWSINILRIIIPYLAAEESQGIGLSRNLFFEGVEIMVSSWS
jgi:hypothetical protein